MEYLGEVREYWNKNSDGWYKKNDTDEIINRIIRDPASAFNERAYRLIRKHFPDMRGKKILVPSSGNNRPVFAFAALGASVTSSDISERQLENAAVIAQKHNWDIDFVRDDTMLMERIKSENYDFVYTSKGTHLWINNLESMYRAIQRVLKDGGVYIMCDIHPFMRLFAYNNSSVKITKPYTDVSPHFHWRIQDLVNSMVGMGLDLRELMEIHEDNPSFWTENIKGFDKIGEKELAGLCDWRINPLAAMPNWLVMCLVKSQTFEVGPDFIRI